MAMNASVSLCCSALCENRRASKQRCFVPPIPSCARRADLRFWLLSRRPRARRGAARRGAAGVMAVGGQCKNPVCAHVCDAVLAHVCVSLCAGWGPAALGHHTRPTDSVLLRRGFPRCVSHDSHILDSRVLARRLATSRAPQPTSHHLSQMAERNLRTSLRSRHTNQIECSLLQL